MTIRFYSGSGSPYAWRVHLGLEHKALAYETTLLSFSAKETRTPAFTALTPRQQVPLIDDGGYILYESSAIMEYLDDAYPGRGAPLFPGDAAQRGSIRRLVCEVSSYLVPLADAVIDEVLAKPEARDADKLAKARDAARDEFAFYAKAMRGPWLAGPLSAADFTLYPFVAFMFRLEATRMPELAPGQWMPPELLAWRGRVEALPFFDKTYPPHWRAKPA